MLPFSYAIRNLLRDPTRLLQKVCGAALVVFLVFAAGAFNGGMERVLQATGSEQNVILLGAGSEESVERSEVAVQAETLVAAGIRGIDTRAGVPAVSGEVHYMGKVTLSDGEESQALLRGVTPSAFEVHREVRIIEGHFPGPGEIIVGRLAYRTLKADTQELAVGQSLEFEGQQLKVVGHFDAPGTVLESEVWLNRSDLMTLTQRDNLSCVVVRMADADHFARADLFARQRLDLELVALRETEYYGKLAAFYAPIRGMTWLTAVLVAVGAALGGMNMLYAAFASRIREIATLQAIGYSRVSIFSSLLQESLLAALLGTLLASFMAVMLLEGVTVNFSIGTFRLLLTPNVIGLALLSGLLLGSLGAIPPALRCLRAPLPKALRSS
ncbi:ABC transporter permease [Pelagicoccus sp. NFK12]|uniref:ABC transporter permease n=1 Tax=Pelagicoccus enzymogenes TaxID=2773457 RepID=A0A927F6Q9_9BACT|nr:FtsX-like permease family protein [Pelagicoccus enzymogenes]MBD5777993.1 ABC transporter permease [Pelagicoccus enzymogenes]MDQ8197950.1 ABC transporter permease [Pelagicoccus enzymogenes]